MTPKEFDYIYQRLDKILKRTEEDVYEEYLPLQAEVAVTDDHVKWADRLSLQYAPIQEGMSWGTDWQSGWFKLTAEIPASWEGKVLGMRLALGGEALLFDDNGVPLWSFTCGS
ncbi:MAG: hypothetical protein J6S21_00620, partial [Victivallales bacterium]|nr:hypothetical protein [Victivallales bacterium]